MNWAIRQYPRVITSYYRRLSANVADCLHTNQYGICLPSLLLPIILHSFHTFGKPISLSEHMTCVCIGMLHKVILVIFLGWVKLPSLGDLGCYWVVLFSGMLNRSSTEVLTFSAFST